MQEKMQEQIFLLVNANVNFRLSGDIIAVTRHSLEAGKPICTDHYGKIHIVYKHNKVILILRYHTNTG